MECNQKPSLVLVSLVVKHGERDNEENQKRVHNVNNKPQSLHRQRQITSPIVNRVATRLPIGHVGRQHENRDGGDREAENDDDFGEVGLVLVIGVLVIDEEVEVD